VITLGLSQQFTVIFGTLQPQHNGNAGPPLPQEGRVPREWRIDNERVMNGF
jgi:hypothetical protein